MTTTTDARRRFFAIRAMIAKRNAAAAAAVETPAVTQTAKKAPARANKSSAPRREVKTTGEAAPIETRVQKNSLPPAKAIDGTLSDIKRIKSSNGYFTRGLFMIKDGDDYTGVTALISDKAKKALGKNLKDGPVKLYGVLQGDNFRVIGLGYAERSTTQAPSRAAGVAKDVDYSFQHDAIFNAAA